MNPFAATVAMREIAEVRKARAKKAAFAGIPLRIDRPRGFVQTGNAPDGTPWERVYRYDYGYLPRTEGGDGEGVDVFLGSHEDAPDSYWAWQIKADGSFDEFKVFLGFGSQDLARVVYNMHIPPRFCASWSTLPVPVLRSLLGLPPGAVIEV